MKNIVLSLFLIPSLVYSNAVKDKEKLKEHCECESQIRLNDLIEFMQNEMIKTQNEMLDEVNNVPSESTHYFRRGKYATLKQIFFHYYVFFPSTFEKTTLDNNLKK